MNKLLTELFKHDKNNFDANIKKLDLYIKEDQLKKYEKVEIDIIKMVYFENDSLLNMLLHDVIIARNSYNM